MKASWTTENAKNRLNDILNLPNEQRIEIANNIRQNLKDWGVKNFRLTPNQEKCRNMLPDEYWEETGYMLSHAIEKKFPIEISVTEGDVPLDQVTRNDGGEIGWGQKTGFYGKYTFKF